MGIRSWAPSLVHIRDAIIWPLRYCGEYARFPINLQSSRTNASYNAGYYPGKVHVEPGPATDHNEVRMEELLFYMYQWNSGCCKYYLYTGHNDMRKSEPVTI